MAIRHVLPSQEGYEVALLGDEDLPGTTVADHVKAKEAFDLPQFLQLVYPGQPVLHPADESYRFGRNQKVVDVQHDQDSQFPMTKQANVGIQRFEAYILHHWLNRHEPVERALAEAVQGLPELANHPPGFVETRGRLYEVGHALGNASVKERGFEVELQALEVLDRDEGKERLNSNAIDNSSVDVLGVPRALVKVATNHPSCPRGCDASGRILFLIIYPFA